MQRLPDLSILDCAIGAGPGRPLAFGLHWMALIGSNAPALAKARARQLRATHYALGGAPAAVAGFGRARARARQRQAAQAAALVFAQCHPRGGHCILRLPDGRYWLAAARDGTVLSAGDRLYASQAAAESARAQLLSQRPDLAALDPAEVWTRLCAGGDAACRLIPVPSRWSELPWTVRVFLLCLAASALGPWLWHSWNRPAPEDAGTPAADASAGDARQAWDDALSQAMRRLRAHDGSEPGRLIAGLAGVPLSLEGWALRRAHCDAMDAQWRCSAFYARAYPFATNQGLAARRPSGWNLSFNPLEEAVLSWRLAAGERPLSAIALPSGHEVDIRVASVLQTLAPAFSSVSLGQPARAAFAEGIARPAGAPELRARTVSLHGPLRSLVLLSGAFSSARWSRLVLNIQPQARAGLASSMLAAELQGVLYEHD
ncbi:type 4b pilus protein PilO2 [Achromobacter sp. Marseille-Q4962]|uniref:type 4b pilus protein PilO2 n=1 Tax=Achromobacter sp. Marseille-Q4962 TaxID=2942202 RepID=UPI002073749A|nr:type 4b pilus protein PilO2 [Achromobacter sp. Marseille-Q4962]